MTIRWIKLITTIGLSMMTKEMRRERMNRIFTGNTEISGEALAELIDESKAAAGAFLEEHKDSQAINEEQKNTIREMLKKIDGKTEVATIGLTEDIDMHPKS